MPVLNVSSRVTWLELDDKALLESYAVLQTTGAPTEVITEKTFRKNGADCRPSIFGWRSS